MVGARSDAPSLGSVQANGKITRVLFGGAPISGFKSVLRSDPAI
jgi:hypothetical protein